MKTAKKLAACVLAAAFMFGMAACAGGDDGKGGVPEAAELLAEYRSEKTTVIGAWGQPYHSYEAYKSAADMGLTHIYLESDGMRNFIAAPNKQDSSQDLLEVEEWFPELGLKAVWQQRFDPDASVSVNTGNPYYSDYDCTAWLNMCDEPIYSWLDSLEKAMLEFDRLYKDKDYYAFTNLWPSSAGGSIGADYSEYVQRYAQMISKMSEGKRIMSVDVYPLVNRNGSLSIDGSWLKNMYDVKVAAEEIDSEFHMYIQSVGYTLHRRPKTRAEIGFQVWTDLCFGIDGFTYFTFAGDGSNDNWAYTPAIVKATSPTGEPWDQEYYDGCKTVNDQVHKLDLVYHCFDWQGVMSVQGTQTETADTGLYSISNISLRSGEGDADFLDKLTATLGTVAGVFEAEINGENGEKTVRNAVMVSNYTDPKDSYSNTVTLGFSDATHALVYYKGEWTLRKIARGELEVFLESGEGAFVIPYKF